MRKLLKIAVTVLSLAACLGWMAWWARSHWVYETIRAPASLAATSIPGLMIVTNDSNPVTHWQWSGNSKMGRFDDWVYPQWQWRRNLNGTWYVVFPHWIAALLCATIAALPWLRWRRPTVRSLRFSLRSLFIAFTAVAVLGWYYWSGRFMRQEAQLERSVKQLKSGQTFEHAIMKSGQDHVALMSGTRGADGKDYGWIRFQWPNATYLLVAGLGESADGTLDSSKLTSIRVYRIPPAPDGYLPQTARGREEAMFLSRNGESEDEVSKSAYWYDFLSIAVGDSPDTLGFQSKLIHSDPPVPAPSK